MCYIVLCESDPAHLSVRQPRRTAHALPRLVRGDFTLPTYMSHPYVHVYTVCESVYSI